MKPVSFENLSASAEDAVEFCEKTGIEFIDDPKMRNYWESLIKRMRLVSELQSVVSELEVRDGTACRFDRPLQDVTYYELCGRGVDLLTQLRDEYAWAEKELQ